MQDLLHRLYRTRIALLAVLLMTAGVGLMLLAPLLLTATGWAWLGVLQLPELGLVLLTTGLVSVAWQYAAQEVSEARTKQLFLSAMTQQAPAIRDAVIQGFAFTPDDLARVASPKTMDQIVENTLALQLGDRSLATAAYADLRQQVIQSPERRYDAVVSVDLAPWTLDASATEPMFIASIRWEYRIVPAEPAMRFACVSNLDEHRELLNDPTVALSWYFKPTNDLHGGSDDAFALTEFKLDGKALPIRRTKRAKGQSFSVNLGKAGFDDAAASSSPREVTISYTYQVLVRQHGHLLGLNIGQLTKGLKVSFRYGGCGIREVNTLDYIASAEPTRLSQTPATAPTPAVEVGFDGWVMARSGVAFSWVLEGETVGKGRWPA